MNNTTKTATCQPTLAHLAKMDNVSMTPDEAAKYIGCSPNLIRVMAATPEGRQGLGFPVIRVGSDTKVLRIPLLRYLGWEGRINGATEEAYAG